jgi:mono/diheme cytochrome c family protein
MTKFLILPLGFLISVASASSASAQAPNLFIGRQIAKTVCDACHQVDSSYPPNPKFPAPSFLDISRMPSMNELAIKVFLRTSHPAMPNIILSQEETDSIAAYIMSLSGK